MTELGRQPQISARRADSGVSLVETLMTLVVLAIASSIAIALMTNVIPSVHADSSLEMVVATLQQAHEGAINQRRDFLVTFIGTNEIKVQRQELDGSLTTISDYFLGNGVTYTVPAGITTDTPDGFDTGLTPVNFSGSNTIAFLSDGTAVNSTNQLMNGTAFMAIAGQPSTARAVTVMGATSRIKGYRYNGSAWN